VVVSSTWRHGYTPKGLQLLLEARGFKGKVIDKTPSLWRARGLEIQAWLDEHHEHLSLQGYTCPPFPGSVESLVILDDDTDMEHWLPRLIRTDNKVGLQAVDIERAIKMLEEPIG
jgi:hypothetical protein